MRERVAQWSQKGVSLVERSIPRSDRIRASDAYDKRTITAPQRNRGVSLFPAL